MDRNELEQQLWELVYELLPADEAAALRERVTSDPEVARAYAEVKLQAELLAHAAAYDTAPIPLARPAEDSPPATKVAPRAAGRRVVPPWTSATRVANWALGLATVLLIGFVGFSYWSGRGTEGRTTAGSAQTLLAQAVHTTLIGPPRLQPNHANFLTALTRRNDGQPCTAQLVARFYSADGQLRATRPATTSPDGVSAIEIPHLADSSWVRLELETQNGLATAPLSTTLTFDAGPLTTYLTCDRSSYRPGDTVNYRAQTLPAFAGELADETAVEFLAVDQAGAEVPNSRRCAVSEHGITEGQLELPANAASARLTLVARSPSGQYPEARAVLQVRAAAEPAAPALASRLKFSRDRFAPGDNVTAELELKAADGQPAANTPLRVRADVEGRERVNLYTAADESGKYQLKFALPKNMQQPAGRVEVDVGDPPHETLAESIPLAAPAEIVEFYPESGDLVVGQPNRVYFQAQDAAGEALAIRGRVLDQHGTAVANVKSVRPGRGVFALTPLPGQAYTLQIAEPAGVAARIALPAVQPDRFVTFDAGPGVFDDGPLVLTLHSNRCSRPLAVTVSCREALVGQALVSREDFASPADDRGSCRLAVPVDPRADGVLRVTIHDLTAVPSAAVAERLVFRRPARKLDVQVTPAEQTTTDRDVHLAVQVVDEQGRPQQATLGITVVPAETGQADQDSPPSLASQVWLLGSLGSASRVGPMEPSAGTAAGVAATELARWRDARIDAFLQVNPETAAELDWLLAARAPAWQIRYRPEQLAQARSGNQYAGRPAKPTSEDANSEAVSLVVIADNGQEVQATLRRLVEQQPAAYQFDLRAVGRVAIAGGLALLIALVIFGWLRMTAGAKVWAPVLGTAAACIVLGVLWLGNSPPTSDADREVQVAKLDQSKDVEPPAERSARVSAPGSARVSDPAETADQRSPQNGSPTPKHQRAAPQSELARATEEGSAVMSRPTDKGERSSEPVNRGVAGRNAVPEAKSAPDEGALRDAMGAPAAPARSRQIQGEQALRKSARELAKAHQDVLEAVEKGAAALPPAAEPAPAVAPSAPEPPSRPQVLPADQPARGGGFGAGMGGPAPPAPLAARHSGEPEAPGEREGVSPTVPAPTAGAPLAARKIAPAPGSAPTGGKLSAAASAPADRPAQPGSAGESNELQQRAAADKLRLADDAEMTGKNAVGKSQAEKRRAGRDPDAADRKADDPRSHRRDKSPGREELDAGQDEFAPAKPAAEKPATAEKQKKLKDAVEQLADAKPAPDVPHPAAKAEEMLPAIEAAPQDLAAAQPLPGFDFRATGLETLVWQPRVVTQADGRAEVRFTLPPDLLGYRVLIDAHADGRIGSQRYEFRVPAR